MPRIVDHDICIGCEACAGACPAACITFNDDGKSCIAAADCIDCGACEGVCPVTAISAQ
ncbi:putative ferrodoxin [Spironucleus salmonicida]|uniref:Ferrodoxin n=1 Tax=Spironucleus salmonicida TaxID=348837 RepID=V6LY90_9EUKA|nr:putative ferrodoxin [Spironucleus salmonicida]KAH0577345.1 putative ferrodoxin [Spironucleus salmonicida]|eukprot:EST49544.1 Putative ferrodoxin [Spironucleus salmonicida]